MSRLFGKEIGLRWDNAKSSADASDEWWVKKQLENPLYGKFKNKGLSFTHKLTELFENVVANREFQWAPLSRIFPAGVEVDMNDVYRSSLDGIGVDVEESSRESEDTSVNATNTSVSATDAFGKINLNDSQGIVNQEIGCQKSTEKRKRINHPEKLNKKKATTS
ncbi:uncharacterized protein [Glycine max]|uniref:uncharacterized protein n=1 Tax=Glycine max TaxID=3847 RepID=UPI0003DEB7DB|nr:uncharacterized protein LOC102665321 [Glycine max]|eukprot:XP_006576061.1 uncharacterized protein LOC102665321 [Glycine max]